MKKLIIAGIAAIAAAVGVWLGVPVYADSEFKGALDSYFATKADDRVGYQDAKLEYWQDRMEIGAVTDLATVEIAGQSLRVLVTFNDLVVEGYDLDEANAAMAGADGKTELIAQRISWSGFTLNTGGGLNEADLGAMAGKAGALDGVKADQLDLDNILKSVGLEVAAVQQGEIVFTWAKDAESMAARLSALDAQNLQSAGVNALKISGFELGGKFAKDETSGEFSMSWAEQSYEGLKVSDVLAVQRVEVKDAKANFSLSAPPPGGGAPEAVTGEVRYASYVIENGDVDYEVFNIYPKVFELAKLSDNEPQPEEIAQVFEFLVSILESIVEKNTGVDVLTMTDIVIDIPKLQTQSIKRMEARDYRGLKIGFLEVTEIKQSMPVGGDTIVDFFKSENIDLSALPAYLRAVFGNTITPDSLAHAQAYYESNPIAAAIPAISFGQWELKNQVISLPDGGSIRIGDVSMIPMRADAYGQVQFASTVSGMALPLDKLAENDLRASEAFAILHAQGIKQVSISYGIDVTASPKAGTVDVDTLSVALENLGAVSISGKVSGIDIEELRNLPEHEWSGPFMQSGVGGLRIQIKDEGLRQFAFNMLGQQQGGQPEQVAEGLAMQAEQLAGQFGSARATAVGQAIAAFLREGGAITVTAAKESPTPIIDIIMAMQTQGPPAVLEVLQIEAVQAP